MEASHRWREDQAVGILSDMSVHWVGAKVVVRKLLRGAGGLDIFRIKVDLVARREGWRWGVTAIVVLCHVVLCLSECRLGFFQCILHPIHKLVNCFHLGWRLVRFKAHLRVLASIKEEGCLLRGGMNVVVIGEFHKGKKWKP